MTALIARVLTICLLAANAAWASDSAHVRDAMAELRAGRWNEAYAAAGQPGTVPWDIIEWHRLREGFGTAAEVERFLARRGDWPGIDLLRRRGEAAMDSAGSDRLRAFYAETPPLSPEGVLSLARVLREDGKGGDADAELVLAWRTRPMGSGIQATYLRDHSKLLAPHHAARLNRMLWDGHLSSARRMLSLVDDDTRKLAEARIALRGQAAGVDALIEAVPERLRNHPGLAFERFFWRARKNRLEGAIEILLQHSSDAESLGEPGKWGRKRAEIARRILRSGDARRAYDIAASHHTSAADGYIHADLEWLSGFIALRFVQRPKLAVEHFRRFDAAVETPISKGRAGYWLGRALEAAGDKPAAKAAYEMGAKYQSSFYGLLAAERGGVAFDQNFETPPEVADWRKAAFMESTVTQAGLALLAAGEMDLAERFFTHLVESLSDVDGLRLGQMMLDLNQPHLAVMVAKRAARQGQILYGAYYPLHPLAEMALPMAPEMSLAIARRESEFDPGVVSGAGAQGLMQVMPATARNVAATMGILANHETGRLLSEWDYNARLGSTYLAQLAGELGGNVVMMAAGYNAGPGRPRRWMEIFGDPRGRSEEAMIDWIELIPFDETRNYVMRVTESLPVYRARLGKDPLPVPFSQELLGSTLLPFAP